MMLKTLGQLAEAIEGHCIGNATLTIHRVVHPMQVQSEQDLALVLDAAILPVLAQMGIQTALVPEDPEFTGIPNRIRVKRPKVALAKLLDIFEQPAYIPPGIHPSSVIDPTAVLGEGVTIGPLCSVGPGTTIGVGTRLVSHVTVGANVAIGERCLFHAGARIGDRIAIGHRVILQPNATIGSDGFSFVTAQAGSVETARSTGAVLAGNTEILRINSIGTVVLEDEVEIGANACVDRATLGETRIQRGTKIDNLVQVAHNVTIGENCLIAGQAAIAGSTKVGARTVIAGQAGLPDHVTIGEDCIIMPQAGVSQSLPDKSIVLGSPAVPRKEFLYKEMQVKRVKGLSQKIEELTRKVSALEATRPEQPVL